MSTTVARTRTAGVVDAPPSRHLHPVTGGAAAAKPRLRYAVTAVVFALVIVAAQLLLSIGVQQGAYQLQGLQSRHAQLVRSAQAASDRVGILDAPQNVAEKAQQLGMVPGTNPVYLRLSDGAILGAPAAAAGAATGNLVPNALLAQQNAESAPRPEHPAAPDQGTPGANATTPASGPIPWEGALPAPETH